jgi:REP element-mobilizing transposase RayT
MKEGIYPVDQVGDKLARLRRIIFGSELDYVGYLPKLGKIKNRGIKGRKGARLYSGILRLMPRRPRIHLAGVPLHSVQRGHNREACFFGEEDSLAYRHGLGEALKESGCALHAWVLMSNPVHWLLTPPQSQDLPRLIILLGRGYVQYINKTYHRTGTL